MTDTLWVALGLLGQILFAGRWVVQWIVSEMRKESVIPMAYWHLSILGSIAVLAYALHKQDIVFVLGQVGSTVIYVRNIALTARRKAEAAA